MMQENSPCGVFVKESKLLFNMVAKQAVTSNVNWLAMLDTLEHTDQGLYAGVIAHSEEKQHKNTQHFGFGFNKVSWLCSTSNDKPD